MKLYIGADCKITMSVTDKSAIVQLFPTANARGIVSVNNDRCQYIARCWNGFKYHVEIFGYSPSDEAGKVAAKEKAEVYLAENSSNNIYDPIEVEFKDITEDIAKDFRYIQSSIDYDVQKVEIDARWMGMWLTKGADDLPVIKVKDLDAHRIYQERRYYKVQDYEAHEAHSRDLHGQLEGDSPGAPRWDH